MRNIEFVKAKNTYLRGNKTIYGVLVPLFNSDYGEYGIAPVNNEFHDWEMIPSPCPIDTSTIQSVNLGITEWRGFKVPFDKEFPDSIILNGLIIQKGGV